MRIRRKPWARPELAACPFCIDEPEKQLGHWHQMFEREQPLHLELGCGKGGFMAQKAVANPDINFLAVDIKSDILGLTKRNIEAAFAQQERPVDNVRIFAYDIERILQVLSKEDVVDRIYINFCNPWPKKKHKKKRLTYPRQLFSYQEFLKDGGEIWFKTDDDELFEESLEYFKLCGFTQKYLTRDLANSGFAENILTEHEKMFMEQGIPIKFLIAQNHGRISQLPPVIPKDSEEQEKESGRMKAICNGRLVMHDRILEGQALLFDEKIIGIVPPEQLPTDCERIDVQGALVTPGLFDVHIHGSGGCDTMDGTEQALHTIASTVVKNGVTRFLATSVTLPLERTAQVFDTVREVVGKSGEGWDAAVIEGINMEGPFINPAYKGAHEENYIADVDFDFMQRYSDVIRLVTVAPEKSGAMEFIKKLTTQTSIRVSIGHTAATYEQAMEAIENGATQVTHLYNAMTPMHHRKPGVVTAALRSNVYTEMICDTIHVHPAMFQFVMDCKTNDRFVLITDCMRAGGMPQGEYTLGELKVVVDQNSARLTDGTLAGSILSLNRAIANVRANTDKPLWEIVNPARALGMQDRIGSLRAGCNADFAIFDDQMNTLMTLVDGRIVYRKEENR